MIDYHLKNYSNAVLRTIRSYYPEVLVVVKQFILDNQSPSESYLFRF